MYLKVPLVLLALVEGSLLVFAPYLAAAVLWQGHDSQVDTATGNLLPNALLFALFSLASLGAVGLFSTRQRSGRVGVLVRVVAAIVSATALSALISYFVPALRMDRSMLLTTAAISIVTSFFVRLLFERIVEEDFFRRRVLVYGAGKRARSLLELRRRSDTRGFRIIGFMATEGDNIIVPPERVIARPADLFEWAIAHNLDEIVMAMDDRRRGFPMHELLECRLAGIEMVELPSFLERETGKVRLDVLEPQLDHLW